MGVSVWEGTFGSKAIPDEQFDRNWHLNGPFQTRVFLLLTRPARRLLRKVYTKIGADRNALLLPANLEQHTYFAAVSC